jgi:protein involved in polysaccharide export with SLBB domain
MHKICSLTFLLALVACSSTAPKWQETERTELAKFQSAALESPDRVEPIDWQSRPENEVAPGFQIRVRGAADTELNGVFQTDFRGYLDLPYELRVKAADISIERLQDEVRRAYSAYLRSTANVIVEIYERQYWVQAQGLLNSPGQYLLRQNSSLAELIRQADGLKEGATTREVQARYARIEHKGGTSLVNLQDYFSGSYSLDPNWQGGEVVFFQTEMGDAGAAGDTRQRLERQYVKVLGQVRSPGSYPYDRRSDFYRYLVAAGGPVEGANVDNISLIRPGENSSRTLSFRMNDARSVPAIEPGDTIIVNPDTTTALERQGNIMASFAGVLSALAAVALLAVAL